MRRAQMKRGTKRMRRVSKKRADAQTYTRHDPVYAAVDRRSGLRCEIVLDGHRCTKRQRDHHHTLGRDGEGHLPVNVMGICRNHHDMTEASTLITEPRGDETFACRIVTRNFFLDQESRQA